MQLIIIIIKKVLINQVLKFKCWIYIELLAVFSIAEKQKCSETELRFV